MCARNEAAASLFLFFVKFSFSSKGDGTFLFKKRKGMYLDSGRIMILIFLI